MKEQIELDDGWIPIATMLKFARLSQLTNSPQVIFAALKKSTLMEVNENSAKLRRSKEKPIPLETPEYLAEVRARTIYCKGLPKEYMTIDKLLEFFKSFPTVLNIKVCFFYLYFVVSIIFKVLIQTICLDALLQVIRRYSQIQRINQCYILYQGRSCTVHLS